MRHHWSDRGSEGSRNSGRVGLPFWRGPIPNRVSRALSIAAGLVGTGALAFTPLRAEGATLDLNGLPVTLPAAPFTTPYLTGSNNVTNNGSATAALIEGGGPAGTIYSGVISNGTSATAWEHTGGNVILTGANTFTGETTIDGGTVQVGNGGTAGQISQGIVNNGTLILDRSDDVFISNLQRDGFGDQTGSRRTILC